MSTALQQQKISYNRQLFLPVFAAVVAFLAYASVYAYRKPFTVATFDGIKFWGISYQTLLIISQVVGYMLSKFYGIKFIAESFRMPVNLPFSSRTNSPPLGFFVSSLIPASLRAALLANAIFGFAL